MAIKKTTRQRGADSSRDRKVFSRAWEGRSWRLTVSVHSYEGGPPRLQITREKTSKRYENRPFAKLGRFSPEEIDGILPILEEARTHMGKAKKPENMEMQRHRIKKGIKAVNRPKNEGA